MAKHPGTAAVQTGTSEMAERSGGPEGVHPSAEDSPLLSREVLERMKQRKASTKQGTQLTSGRKRNSIDLSSFGKGLVVETF